MKRFTGSWTLAAVMAALLMVPAAGWTQTQQPPDPTPPPGQEEPASTPQPQPPAGQEPTGTTGRPPDSPAQQQNAGNAVLRQHLTAARNTLSEMTQLPAAAQLTGDARNEVSQLISNFNELITSTTEWRAAHAKVEGNLVTLLGPEEGEPARSQPDAPEAADTGIADLDAEIRGKLVEFRNHLNEFERAASGASDVETRASATDPTAGSGATSTGAEHQTPGTLPGDSPTGVQPSPSTDPTAAAADTDEAIRHLEAIEAILNVQPESSPQGPVGTTGMPDPAASAAPGTQPEAGALDAAKVELLRDHLRELRRVLEERR